MWNYQSRICTQSFMKNKLNSVPDRALHIEIIFWKLFSECTSHLHPSADTSTPYTPSVALSLSIYQRLYDDSWVFENDRYQNDYISHKGILVKIIVAYHHVVNLNSLLVQISQCLGGRLFSPRRLNFAATDSLFFPLLFHFSCFIFNKIIWKTRKTTKRSWNQFKRN